jgi:hypothetical protein
VQQVAPHTESGETQAPLQQTLPPVQRVPQEPQLAASRRKAVAGSTQRSPHAWSPVGQAQRPRPVMSGGLQTPLSQSLPFRHMAPMPRGERAASVSVEWETASALPMDAPSDLKNVLRVRGAASDFTMRSKRLPSTRITFSRTMWVTHRAYRR